jgi:hypothetical protein
MDGIIRNTTMPKKFSLRELDFFSEGASIKIKNDERVKSNFGGFLSIIIYGLLGAAIYYYLTQYLDTTNPKLQNNTRLLPNPSNFTSSKGGIGGTFLFFLITNPSDKAGVTEPKYLTMTTYSNYYLITSTYTESAYKIEGQIVKVDKTANKEPVAVKMISCKDAAWFKAEANQQTLQANNYTKFLIQEFGLCPVFTDSMSMYGDDQTLASGKYRFVLESCVAPACDPQVAFPIVLKSSGQSVTIGAFQPVVNNALKYAPFEYEINTENVIPLNQFLNSKVIMSLKELYVETDMGKFIQDTQAESRAAIGIYHVSYDPVVTVGDSDASDPTFTNFNVKYVSPSVPPMTITLVSSRLSQQVSRSYDTILDLISNSGGAGEALIMILLVLFHWIENMHVESRINSVVGKYLGLPELIRPQLNMFNPLMRLFVTQKVKKSQLDSDEVIAGIVDKALSVEQMSYNQIMLRFFLEHSLPWELTELIPVVYVMKELLQKHFEEEASKAKGQEAKNQIPENQKNDLQKSIILQPVDSELKAIKGNDERNSLTELHQLRVTPHHNSPNIQSPEAQTDINSKNHQENSNLPIDQAETMKIDAEVKDAKRLERAGSVLGLVNTNQPELPEPELNPGGINFRELFGTLNDESLTKSNPPTKNLDYGMPDVPNELEGSIDQNETPIRDDQRDDQKQVAKSDTRKQGGSHQQKTLEKQRNPKSSKKTTWMPYLESLKQKGELDGNEKDLAEVQKLSKSKPILLKSYQVLRGNLSVEDEHQQMRKNLFGIIQEFCEVKNFTIEDVFGKEDNNQLRESWVRPVKSSSNVQKEK